MIKYSLSGGEWTKCVPQTERSYILLYRLHEMIKTCYYVFHLWASLRNNTMVYSPFSTLIICRQLCLLPVLKAGQCLLTGGYMNDGNRNANENNVLYFLYFSNVHIFCERHKIYRCHDLEIMSLTTSGKSA